MRYSLSTALAVLVFAGTVVAAGTAHAQYVVPTGDDASLVASWYLRLLGRQPDAAGLQGWVQELHRGRNVEAAILGSDEFYQRNGSTPAGFVTGLYVSVLSREPAASEVQGWLDRLQQQGFNREATAADFLNAASFELSTRGIGQEPTLYQLPLPAPSPTVVPAPPYYRPLLPHRTWYHFRT